MNSYKIYSNCINGKASNNFFKFVLSVIESYETNFCQDKKFLGWDDLYFNKKLIELRKNKKEVFSAIYNSILVSNYLQKIPFENNLYKIASNFLKLDDSKLTMRGVTFRMDPPNDTRNSYGWHQDSAYDKFNVNSENGAILWVPLVNTSKNNGTLIIKPGSEYSDLYCSELSKQGTKYRSQQILVKDKYLKKYKNKHISVKKNDALTTYNGVFHKSGTNSSNKFRFTIITRYSNLFSEDFIFRRNLKIK